MYWVAPTKFSGDLSACFGDSLSYDIPQTPVTSQFLAGASDDVSIASAAATLV